MRWSLFSLRDNLPGVDLYSLTARDDNRRRWMMINPFVAPERNDAIHTPENYAARSRWTDNGASVLTHKSMHWTPGHRRGSQIWIGKREHG